MLIFPSPEPHILSYFDVLLFSLTAVTTETQQRIGELYAIEAEIRGSPAEEWQALRKSHWLL